MKVSTTRWTPGEGWSSALPDLDSPSTLVLVFGDRAVEDDDTHLQTLIDSFPQSIVTGCSTSGQIMGPSLCDGGLSVAIACFDRTRLAKAATDVSRSADSSAAGHSLGGALAADDLRAVFVLSDGLGVNGTELVAGLLSAVGSGVLVTGGLAADGDHFERTWVIDDGARRPGRIVAVGFYGDALHVGSGSEGGWGIFGPERIVTRSEGSVLYELDGNPALELYKRYLGELAVDLPASALLYPLAIRPAEGRNQLVRTVLAVDDEDQSMTFAGDIPQGWRAQLMRASPDRLIDGATGAAADSGIGLAPVGPTLAVAISCVGRRLVLGERTDEEIEATLEALPEGSELAGFYSYGEIAPGVSGRCDLHNQTMTITTFSED